MKGLILAAGRGRRLAHLTDDHPKCLNRVGNRSLLEWQIDALSSGGVDDIIIITGYKHELLDSFEFRTVHNERWKTTNMVSSLLCAKAEFDSTTIVTYSDILYSEEIVISLCRQQHEAVIAYDRNWKNLWISRFENPLEDAESFRIDGNGRILEIGQKVGDIDDIMGQYIGIMRFTPEAFDWIDHFTRKHKKSYIDGMDMTMLLQNLIQEEYPIHGIPIKEKWCEIDTPKDFEIAKQIFLNS